MRKTVKDLRLNFFVASKTNLDESFPPQKFVIENFEIRARKDKDGGIIELRKGLIRKGFICKRLNYSETKSLECICSELTLSNKNWICYAIYRPPSAQNLVVLNNELTDSLSKANEKYENFIVMSDFNIDIGLSYGAQEKLDNFFSKQFTKNKLSIGIK